MTHPTDDEIMELAGAWFHTGENQKRDDGYYYRSLGTPSNVRGSDLIEFARALLAEQARPTQVMQEARETLLIAAANFGGVAPSARDRCIRAANALHEVYTAQPLKAEQAKDAAEDAPKLWLWQNFVDGRPEYWAFDNPYPINLTDGDPQTLGEPCGYAIFKPSRQGRFDKSEEQVLGAIARAARAAERKA